MRKKSKWLPMMALGKDMMITASPTHVRVGREIFGPIHWQQGGRAGAKD